MQANRKNNWLPIFPVLFFFPSPSILPSFCIRYAWSVGHRHFPLFTHPVSVSSHPLEGKRDSFMATFLQRGNDRFSSESPWLYIDLSRVPMVREPFFFYPCVVSWQRREYSVLSFFSWEVSILQKNKHVFKILEKNWAISNEFNNSCIKISFSNIIIFKCTQFVFKIHKH